MHETVDSEYSTKDCKSSKINIEATMRNLKMINSFLITLKLNKCVNIQLKKPFVIRYVPDQYTTQETYDKAIIENSRTLESVPGCYKQSTDV